MGLLYALATGTSGRSASGGKVTDTYVKKYKFIKSSPGEQYSVPAILGYGIGAALAGAPNVTCVSIDDQPDGESRLTRNITATFKTVAATGGPTDQQQPPDVRPPNISFQFGLDYVASPSWMADPVANNALTLATSPSGEPINGLEKPQATAIIRLKQFVTSDPANYNEEVGTVNSGNVTFGSFTAIARTLLFKGIDAQPAVEQYADLTYSGWNVTYEFAYRENKQYICTTLNNQPNRAEVNIGWDKAVPLTSRNVLCSIAAGIAIIDPLAFPLEHNKNGSIKTFAGGVIDGKYEFANDPNGNGTVAGQWCRAMTVIPAVKGGFTQVPANEPIAVNLDGSPRSKNFLPLVFRRGFHREIDFRQVLGLR